MASVLAKKQKKKSNYNLKELKTLGNQLLSSRTHINNLPLLITFISPSSSPQFVLESLLSLQSFFITVLSDLPSSNSQINIDENELSKDPELVYKLWLKAKFDDFVKSLIDVAVSSQADETLNEIVLDAIMDFVKLGKDGRFQSSIYQRFLHAIVYSPSGLDSLLNSLVSKFFMYIDVRYFTYITVEKLARSLDSRDKNNKSAHEDSEDLSRPSNLELAIHKIHYILSQIPPFDIKGGQSEYEMWSQLGLSSKEIDGKGLKEVNQKKGPKKCNSDVLSTSQIAKKIKLKFTKAWLSFLRLHLPLDLYKEVLVNLHQAVIPYLSNPIMLCDFLTRSYDIGGVISVMALSSLYILMTQHGLEYPNFYEKLYALLVPSIFMAKHRAKFFELLDSCLKSPLLPAYLAAAFTKKLSRLSLVVPPSGAWVIIVLIHNLLRRHPSINFLVHKQTDETDEDSSRGDGEHCENAKEPDTCDMSNGKPGIDMFNVEETDPAKSNAMRSSLWEVDTLRHHYFPNVNRVVLELEKDLTVRAKTTEMAVKDISGASYATIFNREMSRNFKRPPVTNQITALFPDSDFPGWVFKLDESENDEKSTKRQRIESS
ncbi:hypothetical protein AQUCO_01500322v1 [Aquilegia coerulea]|uniref:CCAAT-binding factor domain-containing protein n=1 Tax=Aquilegia coerulea TaxID=218851 RepID=A0A2G5DT67_AQUCA|nr:hypothetical protein AQUCO_01500322v1 [Aquilegia coerulea]